MRSLFKFSVVLLFLTSNLLFPQYWQKIQNLPGNFTNNYWLDVYFHPQNPNYGWVCGFNGMIVRTTDGGNTWRGSTVNAYHLESVHFPTLQTGYVSGVDGIFKSTDGGATWFDVTPPGTRDTTNFWGCYFLNADYGVLLGDGCGGRYQHFWLTTDGGNSWSVFIAQEENTGMTDAILYPNGLGYASSSGKLWITSDSGRTWRVFATVGPNLWQEEITNVGSSFLVPYSGTSCTGGGNDGGVRFTTDNGATWQSFRTGVPMFGTFLIDNLKGWACGYYQEVYYTSNGGVSWQKRNCGISSANLDDLWFINENNGWVVGEGIYKLANAKAEINKSQLNFPETCVGDTKFDTVWVRNLNFNDANISLSIASGSEDFRIFSPGASRYIQSCDSIRVIVMFNPKSKGTKTGQLEILYPNQSPIVVNLTGTAIEHTAKLIDTLIIIPKVKAGFSYSFEAKISVSTTNEVINSVIPVAENPNFRILSNLPLPLNSLTYNALKFEVLPKDTGWQEITYKVQFSPCDTFQLLKVKVYAISPIINVDSAFALNYQCQISPIYIPIRNSGNDTLFIRKLSFSPTTTKLSLRGWTSGRSLNNNFILPSATDTLIIDIDPKFLGTFSTNLIIENNDMRLVGSPRNILRVNLNIRVFNSELTLSQNELNFETICVGDTIWKKVNIYNQGNIDELVEVQQRLKSIFIVNKPQTFNVHQNDSVEVKIAFVPNQSGKFNDTIIFRGFNCQDTLRLVCRGEAIQTKIICFPSSLYLRIQKGQTNSSTVQLYQMGNDSVRKVQVDFQGEISELAVGYDITGKILPNFGDTALLKITFQGKEKGKYSGKVVIYIQGVCDTVIVIPVTIEVIDKLLVFEPQEILLDTYCEGTLRVQKLTIKNKSEIPDTIKDIRLIQKLNQFKIVNISSFPIILTPFDSIELNVSFNPTYAGYDTCVVSIEFDDTSRNTTIPVYAFWGLSKLNVKSKTFDFGEYEYCQNALPITSFIVNDGNISDSISIVKHFDSKYYSIVFDKYLLNAAMQDTAKFTITFINPQMPGIYRDTIIVGFAFCEQFDTIYVSAKVFEPVFSILPEFIDLDSIWIGNSKDGFLELSNMHSDTLVFSLTGYTNDSNLTFESNYSKAIESKKLDTLKFKIFAKTEGTFVDTLCFKVTSKCEQRKCVYIKYTIPEEKYALTIRIGKYLAKPNDDVNLVIENLSPTPLLKLDTFVLSLRFDQWLFYPITCSFKDGSAIEYLWKLNEFVFTLNGNSLRKFISEGNEILVKGKALYSSPDTTILDLGIQKFLPAKTIDFTLIDGLLKVSPVCAPVGAMHLEIIPSFEILGLNEEEGTSIVVFSDQKQNVDILLYNLLGEFKGEHRGFELGKGINGVQLSKIFGESVATKECFVVIRNEYFSRIVFLPPY